MCAGLLNLHRALVLAVSMAAAVRGRRLAGVVESGRPQFPRASPRRSSGRLRSIILAGEALV
ncbi:MAG TPA: hypothetical protein VFR67_14040 [Pilimelia sp.]|nr:hypothetical protein [Pilimelia sp.]